MEKIVILFKDNNLWINLFFFLMISDFVISYNEFLLYRFWILFSMEMFIILILNVMYNEIYVI